MRMSTLFLDLGSNYGCQVWGVEYLNFNDDSHVCDNPLQKLFFCIVYQGVIGVYIDTHSYLSLVSHCTGYSMLDIVRVTGIKPGRRLAYRVDI
jgi:hypothetical protein